MKSLLKHILFIFVFFVISINCGTMPKQHLIANEKKISSDFDNVWQAVVSFFAENNIPIKTIEKASGLLMAESQVFPENWIDCGKAGMFELRTTPTGVFNVYVRDLGDGSIDVQINSSYQCIRWDTYNNRSLGSMACYSTGIFEELLLDEIYNRSSVITSRVKEKNEDDFISVGTGFLATKSGEIITCYHIIEGKNDINIYTNIDNKKYKANVIMTDKVNDIAVLKVDSMSTILDSLYRSIPYSFLETGNLDMGSKIFTLGYPLESVLSTGVKYNDGIISSNMGIDNDPRIYQISIPVQPGNSGGPVFTFDGTLVGMIVSTLNSATIEKYFGVTPQNVNFAVKSNYIKELLSFISNVVPAEKLQKVPQINELNKYIFKIEAKMDNQITSSNMLSNKNDESSNTREDSVGQKIPSNKKEINIELFDKNNIAIKIGSSVERIAKTYILSEIYREDRLVIYDVDIKQISNIELDKVNLAFYDNSLYSVSIYLKQRDNYIMFKNLIESVYGPGFQLNKNIENYSWNKGKDNVIKEYEFNRISEKANFVIKVKIDKS